MDQQNKGAVLKFSRREFYNTWRSFKKPNRDQKLLEFFCHDFENLLSSDDKTAVLNKIRHCSKQILRRWEHSNRNHKKFESSYEEWLKGEAFLYEIKIDEPEPSTSYSSGGKPRGRPRIDINLASKSTKLRRVKTLVESSSAEELATAATIAVEKSGKRDAARLMREVLSTPTRGTKIKKRLVPAPNPGRTLTGEEALAYYIDSKSSTFSYQQTRKWCLRTGNNVFPALHALRKAKKDCYPSEGTISVSETSADIVVQSIVDKTAERLILSLKDLFIQYSNFSELTLISKWGGDGSSGYSNYKQKFSASDMTDEYLFVFSFVPIRLVNKDGENIWQNPCPGSSRYCRPLKFIFAKETPEMVQTETQTIQSQINDLINSTVNLGEGRCIDVKHTFHLTMVDGKVCNILTDTKSSQKCFICGCTSTQMNSMTVARTPAVHHYTFGLSTLHAWIRSFECFLHISYKLEKKKWRLNESEYREKKKYLQITFKEQMGLIVDKPKPGFGSSNDGNTARRFFNNYEQSAAITGLDAELLRRFDVILRTISSGFEINVEKFEKFAMETKQLYLNLYSWYYMPVTVHKILTHASDIIKYHLLPIGQLSEEAQEARNKDCRRFREHNTRKSSRINTNTDLMNMLILSSDPLINSLREKPTKKAKSLPKDVLELLSQPSVENLTREGNDSDEDLDVSINDSDDS